MKKVQKLALFCIASLSLCVSATFAESKIAVMDYEGVLFNSAAAEDATQSLRVLLEPEQKVLNDVKSQLDIRQGRLTTDKDILTEAEIATFESEIQQLLVEQSNVLAKMQNAQTNSRNEFVQNFQPVISEIVSAVVTENGFTLVLNAQAVLFNAGEPDISEAVMNAFDNWYAEQKAAQQ